MMRHGSIGTKTVRTPDDTVALTSPTPPAPNVMATAAPMAAQRVRINDMTNLLISGPVCQSSATSVGTVPA
jgi:hypothetical protein